MKKNLSVFTLLMVIVFCTVRCSKDGGVVVQPKYGLYNFTTYTIDTFRFKVLFNSQKITDSLVSPVGSISKAVSFFSDEARLQIIDTKNNDQLVIDTNIMMQTGSSTFSLVQLKTGQKPYIPGLPNEAFPPSGKYKIRFQYTPYNGEVNFPAKPFFYDSVLLYVRNNGVDIDTVKLKHFEMTPFYEAKGNGIDLFSIMIEDPFNGEIIDATTSPTIGDNFTGFNTVSLSGRASVDDWRLIRIY